MEFDGFLCLCKVLALLNSGLRLLGREKRLLCGEGDRRYSGAGEAPTALALLRGRPRSTVHPGLGLLPPRLRLVGLAESG